MNSDSWKWYENAATRCKFTSFTRLRKQPTFHDDTTGFLASHTGARVPSPRDEPFVGGYKFPREMTSEERAQKFHTDDVSLVTLIGRAGTESCFNWASTNQRHYPDLVSNTSSVWNPCTPSSELIWRWNQRWSREMLAVFSSKSFTHALDSQPKTKVKLLPETRLTHLSCQTWKQKCKCSQQDSPCTYPPPHLPSGKIGKISMIFWLLASPAALPLSYRRLVEAKAILTLTKKSGLSLTRRCGKILATFSNKT